MLLKIIPALLIVGESYDLRSSDICATLEKTPEHITQGEDLVKVIIPWFTYDRPSLDETGMFDGMKRGHSFRFFTLFERF